MSRVIVPPHTRRLANKINQPGGVTEDEAITAATANLEAMRGRTEHELDSTLKKMRAIGLALQTPPDPAEVRELYNLSNTIVGVAGMYGMTGLSSVAYSLCELIDRMPTASTWNAAAVRIHMDSLLLMQGAGPGEQGESHILDGLRRLMARVPVPDS